GDEGVVVAVNLLRQRQFLAQLLGGLGIVLFGIGNKGQVGAHGDQLGAVGAAELGAHGQRPLEIALGFVEPADVIEGGAHVVEQHRHVGVGGAFGGAVGVERAAVVIFGGLVVAVIEGQQTQIAQRLRHLFAAAAEKAGADDQGGFQQRL